MDEDIKKSKKTLPDMSDEIAEKVFLNTIKVFEGYNETTLIKSLISSVLSLLTCLNIVLFNYRKNFTILQLILILVLLLPFSVLWISYLCKSFNSAFKGMKFENKAKAILQEFPTVQASIDEKCEDNVFFASYIASYGKEQNIFLLSFYLFSACAIPLLILIGYLMEVLKYTDVSITLSVIYFVIISYSGIWGVMKYLKKKL